MSVNQQQYSSSEATSASASDSTPVSSPTASIEPVFIPVTADITPLKELIHGDMPMAELRHIVAEMPFNAAYDFMRAAAWHLHEQGRTAEAIEYISGLSAQIQRHGSDEQPMRDIHAALLQILVALYLMEGSHDEAMHTAATVLTILASEPKRRDEPFLSVLAALLHDVALIHNSRDEYKQAEREIEKSMKIFERLGRTDPERYGAPHTMAVNTATSVYRSRVKQAEALAHYQAATGAYLEQMNAGTEEATDRLIDSLATEGRTLMKMGRSREAVQYFTRALRYLGKIEPELSLRQLTLSIDLGEALLNVKTTRDKGIHLLNTMLHKATKLHATEQHRRIVDILVNAKSHKLDILGLWHKVFPR
ncbi:MAG: hypothetical protein K2M72_04860 [Paramuribaculum sp.]|nr:hypothetical protein [Paramuribaculum sp.]MDE7449527.1 hypothetical protein [Paramuribaculum sp.]